LQPRTGNGVRNGTVFASTFEVKNQGAGLPMLKISVSEQDPSCRIIKLEGKLLQAWVDEVRRFCVEAEDGSLPSLDLSGLSFVDRRGAEMLQQLLRQGVRIHACSPFVAELLHWDRKPNP
jgi:hypothetical protein